MEEMQRVVVAVGMHPEAKQSRMQFCEVVVVAVAVEIGSAGTDFHEDWRVPDGESFVQVQALVVFAPEVVAEAEAGHH